MRYCAREFRIEELELIRRLIAGKPARGRSELSRLICRELGWYKPDGGLKQMSCRVALLRMQADGLIELPPPRGNSPGAKGGAPPRRIEFTSRTDPPASRASVPEGGSGLRLEPVGGREDSRRWNEYIHRYHYLGYRTLPGAQARYFVSAGSRTLALLGFGASAWQCAARDEFIGWSHSQRRRNLHRVVNNARFLILPWVQSENLASKILARAAKQLPGDWRKRYAYPPVLLESFVQRDRFPGTCYRAANWIHVGQTKGRGKLGPSGRSSVPIKDVWLYPLDRDFRRSLTQ